MKNNNNKYLNSVDWKLAHKEVMKIQFKIATQTKLNNIKGINVFQRILVRTHYARLIAIKQVLDSKGSKTLGVDNFIVKSDEDIIELYNFLKNINGYRALPVRRVGILKANGKIRYLGILSIRDRCMQNLFRLALLLVSEIRADIHSYGFRLKRSAIDAATELYFSQYRRGHKKPMNNWLLDADIKGFFDNISHNWIMQNILIEKKVLIQFIKAGYIDIGLKSLKETNLGVLQGGVISPMIANMVLDGLTNYVITGKKDKYVNYILYDLKLIRYADDFVVIGSSKYNIEKALKRAIDFLKERGLELNLDKTKIIDLSKEDANFLGFTLRRVNGNKALLVPQKSKILGLQKKINKTIKKANTSEEIITKLNPIIRGWANYYIGCSASDTFISLGRAIHIRLLKWGMKKLLTRSSVDVYDKYFTTINLNSKELRFYYINKEKLKDDKKSKVFLYDISKTKIKYHRIKRVFIFDLNKRTSITDQKEIYIL